MACVTGVLTAEMSDLTEKEDLLESSGYQYHFDRMLYFSRAARRAFSLEFVEDCSRQTIQRLIGEPPANDWDFHFNSIPSDRVRRELAEALESYKWTKAGAVVPNAQSRLQSHRQPSARSGTLHLGASGLLRDTRICSRAGPNSLHAAPCMHSASPEKGRVAVARQRHLRKAPITEALVQFQVRQGRPDFQKGIEELVAKVAPTLYAKGEIRQGTFQFALDGKQSSQPTVSKVAEAIGVRLHSQDEKYVAQVTSLGLTVSRLEPYLAWETFRTEVRRIWELYRSVFRPESITRVAIRYINTILLSVGPETRLEKVFTRPPMEPEGMSEILSSFLNRSVVEDSPSQASIIVTLASQPPVPPSTFPVILDIEAVRQAEFDVSDSSIWDYLEILRDLKNAAFFGSLTEEQVRLYE